LQVRVLPAEPDGKENKTLENSELGGRVKIGENKFMRIDFDKLTKGALIFSLLLVASSVFYYYVIFLPQKEETRLEQQRQEQLAKEEQERQALEREQKEYVAKRKSECYDIYLQEKKNWSNVKDFSYSEVRDVCLVKYKSDKPAKSEEECGKMIENMSEIKSDTLRDMILDDYFNCLENWFSKEF